MKSKWPFYSVQFPVWLCTLIAKDGELRLRDTALRSGLVYLFDEIVQYPQEKLHAFAFLTNHLHFLVEHPDPEMLIRYVKCETEMFFPELWDKKAVLQRITEQHDFERAFFLIHHEPVWQGFVEDPLDYLYSTYGLYLETFGVQFDQFLKTEQRNIGIRPRSWHSSCVFSSLDS